LSHVERIELNRQLKDAAEVGSTHPNHSEFGSPIVFVRKAYGSLRLYIDYRSLNWGYAYTLKRVNDALDALKDAIRADRAAAGGAFAPVGFGWRSAVFTGVHGQRVVASGVATDVVIVAGTAPAVGARLLGLARAQLLVLVLVGSDMVVAPMVVIMQLLVLARARLLLHRLLDA
jgi:hypothetical protein